MAKTLHVEVANRFPIFILDAAEITAVRCRRNNRSEIFRPTARGNDCLASVRLLALPVSRRCVGPPGWNSRL